MLKTAIAAALSLALVSSPAIAGKRSSPAHPDCNVTMPCQDVAPTPRGLELRQRLPIGEPVQRYQRRPRDDGAGTYLNPTNPLNNPPDLSDLSVTEGMRRMVDSAAAAAGVPAAIAHAVIRHESKYRPHVRGRAGEWGLGQIKCQTARGQGFAGSCAQLADPAENLRWSMSYLRLALDRGGAGCSGVSLYQRGVYAAPRCTAYGRQVMAKAGS